MSWYDFKPYVPVAQRRAQAAREVARRLKKGESILPVQIEGRKITSTFWGKAWCENLEGYSDYANRLPRGRTYVRNGSVIHLKIGKGQINALVSGSEIYEVKIDITPLPAPHWAALKTQCAGQIGSLVELLQGKLSKGVMERVTDREGGLFPKPKAIQMRCSCPDYAGMCKHVAAVMYGVGNRLDASPELLFLLRGVDHTELIEQAIPAATPSRKPAHGAPTIAAAELGAIFDIEIDEETPAREPATSTRKTSAPKKTAKKPAAARKAKSDAAPPAPPSTATPKTRAPKKTVKKAPAARKTNGAASARKKP